MKIKKMMNVKMAKLAKAIKGFFPLRVAIKGAKAYTLVLATLPIMFTEPRL